MPADSKKAFELGNAAIERVTPLETAKSKWIGLERIDWRDEEGTEREWECATRKTRSKGGIDAVSILPLIVHPSRPLSTLIVQQFRPPAGKVCVELPAGLIDEGEGPVESARRELVEETGYGAESGKVEVVGESTAIVSDPGMTSANLSLVTLRVQLGENDPDPEPKLEKGEHIVTQVVPMKDLLSTLQNFSKRNGYIVDARLYHIAWGYHLGQSSATLAKAAAL